ncbi:MAG: cold-shock protein [Solirubrobacteraceae bacterium]
MDARAGSGGGDCGGGGPAALSAQAGGGITGDGYRSLPEGSKVSYEEEAGPKGPKAIDVSKL